jgi:hypothetical protein
MPDLKTRNVLNSPAKDFELPDEPSTLDRKSEAYSNLILLVLGIVFGFLLGFACGS